MLHRLGRVTGERGRARSENPLEHYLCHPRSFLDISDHPEEQRLVARVWCLECDYELELSDEDAERWADLGVPWRTGTE